MDAVIKGLVRKYRADSAIVAATTGLFLGVAPQGTATPFITLNVIGGYPWDTFDKENELYEIQFSIFDKDTSANTLYSVYDKLKTCFDWTAITISGYVSLYFKRIAQPILELLEDNVKQLIVTYRGEIEAE